MPPRPSSHAPRCPHVHSAVYSPHSPVCAEEKAKLPPGGDLSPKAACVLRAVKDDIRARPVLVDYSAISHQSSVISHQSDVLVDYSAEAEAA
eukprot:5859617-Prymnesium_polylepis.1